MRIENPALIDAIKAESYWCQDLSPVLLRPILVRTPRGYDFFGSEQELARFWERLRSVGVFNGN